MPDPDELQDRIDDLEGEIKDVKDHVPESQGGTPQRKFIDDGTEDEDQPVDNTIAPPG